MKRLLLRIGLALSVVHATPALCAASLPEGGGDLRVALFSARAVHAITLVPLGAGAWTAACAGCAHKPWVGELVFRGKGELFAGGSVQAQDGSGSKRVVTGLWHLRGAADGSVDAVVTVPSEQYVAAVVNAEAAPDEPFASLQALAVVARTYALQGRHFKPVQGHLDADLCDSTACQAVRFGVAPQPVTEAVRLTAGETLWVQQERAAVFFSQHCGGVSESAGALWPDLRRVPYLQTKRDPFCVRRDPAAWHTEVSLNELAALATSEGWKLPTAVRTARVIERTASGRARLIEFAGAGGRESVVAAPSLRLAIGRALGWDRIRSDLYEVAVRHSALVFDGRGHGHGVGLCQAGAAEMAREGKTAGEILTFYFPGTRRGVSEHDTGWHTETVGPVQVRAVQPLREADREAMMRAWQSAAARWASFAPGGTDRTLHDASTLVLAPSTELFRQESRQPGWSLASTRGSTTVVQPLTVLARRGLSLEDLLRHEYLHQQVESQAGPSTPLWLREGLVEELAGEPVPLRALEPVVGDRELVDASTWEASLRAHRAAQGRVHLLLQRHGVATVLVWLRRGVPSDLL